MRFRTMRWQRIDVVGAGDGHQALDLLEWENPDRGLLDIGLPGLDGYRMLQ